MALAKLGVKRDGLWSGYFRLKVTALPISDCKQQISPECRGKFIKSNEEQTSCLHCIRYRK